LGVQGKIFLQAGAARRMGTLFPQQWHYLLGLVLLANLELLVG
jgi:hypothetical protein